MWEAELAVRHYGCPVSDVSSSHSSVRIENVSRVRLTGGEAKRLLAVDGAESKVAAFAENYRDHDATVEFERVSAGDANRAYFISEVNYPANNPSILKLIDDAGCFQYSTVVVEHGIEHWVVYTRHKDALRRLVDAIEERSNNVRLARNVDVGPISDEEAIHYHALRSELTKQQLAAFEAALELGYYAENNQATISDIAAFLDVHHSTAGEHIKRVENTLLSEVGRHLFPDVVNQNTQPETLRSDPSEC
ncbi:MULTISPECIES: helix-turn-helix domain-containing protein [Halorubrum]|uniref:Predicted DNA binding protein, contains HTH domain n=1 Tax=Halorubrum sodomense TaxID=35743 RepID=A0A1I6H1J0_HALSD|nr:MULTISPECIES: helix-turn-helix domain-containing protein [Halorubrum]TKX55010.1 hypothetical protein EXE42_05785 [Halorubrum sp. SP3]TKX55364.1 hypothetical protein EXE44_16375 [Halorubrum sp. SS7]SFR48323.1 Predicted DNA binding protein, contains HTH domain [Halorubrum sodomense]